MLAVVQLHLTRRGPPFYRSCVDSNTAEVLKELGILDSLENRDMSAAIEPLLPGAASQRKAQKAATKPKSTRSPSMTLTATAPGSMNPTGMNYSASCPNGTVLVTSRQADISKHGGRANMYVFWIIVSSRVC